MLNELLDLSKIEAGKIELRPTVLSIQELIADVLDVLQPLARQKSITMEVTSLDGIPKVHADRDKLYEVLANLVDNSIKFSPSGGRIQIGTKVLNDRYLRVEVSDTGCGIPEEDLPKIFDKFYRVQSVSANHAGAGLGLAIAKGLIELHGGTIGVDSTSGKGSHFYFTVPYVTSTVA